MLSARYIGNKFYWNSNKRQCIKRRDHWEKFHRSWELNRTKGSPTEVSLVFGRQGKAVQLQ